MGALEALAGELACARITPEEIAQIKALTFQMLACRARRDLPSYYRLNREIHDRINAAARNRALAQTYANAEPAHPEPALPLQLRRRQVGQGRAPARGDGRGARGARRPAARAHPARSPAREVRRGARTMKRAELRERPRRAQPLRSIRRTTTAGSASACAPPCAAMCCSTARRAAATRPTPRSTR